MEPWEQHHAVINMPRFEYDPEAALQRNAGFLITCAFRREKSATKEALALLREYLTVTGEPLPEVKNAASTTESRYRADEVPVIPCSAEEVSVPSKKAKTATAANWGQATPADSRGIADDGEADSGSCGDAEERGGGQQPPRCSDDSTTAVETPKFMLVKLAMMGAVYICASGTSPRSVLDVASRLLMDVQTGSRAAPLWCNRMLPVQVSCAMNKDKLEDAAKELVEDYIRNNVHSAEEPLNYAIAFNRRGAGVVASPNDGRESDVLSREECIKIVTPAVEQVTVTRKVNLTSPQVVILVELIPVAGIRTSLMCAISVVPGDLVLSKPRLSFKPLTSMHPNSIKRKQLNYN